MGRVGDTESGLQPVAECRQLIDPRHDAVLLGKGWERNGDAVHPGLVHFGLRRACDEWKQIRRINYVFFFFTPARRRIVHCNVTAHPTAPWGWRQWLEATPWGQQPRYLIRDRDRSYGGAFIGKARAIGIKTVLTSVRPPKANAIAECVIGTLRRECLDHLTIVNERHLRLGLREYVAHYNHVRPHQALELWAPDDRRPRSPPRSERQVAGRPILGGLHHEYQRLAA